MHLVWDDKISIEVWYPVQRSLIVPVSLSEPDDGQQAEADDANSEVVHDWVQQVAEHSPLVPTWSLGIDSGADLDVAVADSDSDSDSDLGLLVFLANRSPGPSRPRPDAIFYTPQQLVLQPQ
jgi:hypothetical protein